MKLTFYQIYYHLKKNMMPGGFPAIPAKYRWKGRFITGMDKTAEGIWS